MKSIKEFFNNSIVQNVLVSILVIISVQILLNIAFMADFLFQTMLDFILKLFIRSNLNRTMWYPSLKHFLFLLIIALITWIIIRSKLNRIIKAIYISVPLAAAYLTIGMFLYKWQKISITVSNILSILILYYLVRNKKHWLYFLVFIIIVITFLLVSIFKIQI